MAATGATLVVNGLGLKTVAAGRGTRVAIVTRGMALPGIIRRVRLSRRIAFGGHCRVRLIAAARRRPRHLTTVGAASTGLFISCLLANANSEVVSATVREKKRSGTVNLVGAALTEKLCRPLGRTAKPNVASVTTRRWRRSGIAFLVGAA